MKKSVNITSKWAAIGLALLLLLIINIIGSIIPGQLDMTADNLYTLSDGTKKLLEKIEEPVTLEYYYSRTTEDQPIFLKNFASRIEALLKQYENAADGQIKVRIIDPKPDTDEEEAAIRAQIQPQNMQNGESVFNGLVIIQADQEVVLPALVATRESFLEYDISRAIYQVQKVNLPKLGILSTLPVLGEEPNPYMPPQQQQASQDWVCISELKKTFDVIRIDPAGENIPGDLDVLAVIHPQNLSEIMEFAIDQFILSGKPTVIAVDPSSISQKENMPPQQARMMGYQGMNTSSSLPRLFAKYGIEYDPTKFLADIDNATTVYSGQGGGTIRYPAWLNIENLDDKSPATAQLNQVVIPETGVFDVKEDSSLELQKLIVSSRRSSLLDANILNFTPPAEITKQVEPSDKEYTIAGILRGKLKTAFPQGKPEKAEADEAGEMPAPPAPAGPELPALKESVDTSSIILVADTDFMSDRFSVQKLGFFGLIRPINDNLSLVSNVVEFISGSEDLLSLRGKGTAIRPFDVVDKKEQEAQEKYQEQIDELNEELKKIREELRTHRSQQEDEQRLVVSKEVQEKVANYRLQEAQTQRQIREIRLKATEDIKDLEIRLTSLNLFVVPVLIGLYSLVYFVLRGKQRKTKADLANLE